MNTDWTQVLDKYIHKLVSPDGRQTYESKPELVNLIMELAQLQKTDTVIDIGCGWGNFLKACAEAAGEVIGIEPYLTDNEIYTVNDMKENSPQDNWLYSIKDAKTWAGKAGLKLEKTVELCLFFGVAVFKKK